MNHMTTIRSQHDEYSLRFAAALNQVSSFTSWVLVFDEVFIPVNFLLLIRLS